MSKRQIKAVSGLSSDNWKTVSTGGFPPIWKPESDGEYVEIIPLSIQRSNLQSKKKMQANFLLQGSIQDTNSESFFVGGGKNQTRQVVGKTDIVSVPLSKALMGETEKDMRLAYMKGNECIMTALAIQGSLRIIYHGTVPLPGGQRVKRMAIQIPS